MLRLREGSRSERTQGVDACGANRPFSLVSTEGWDSIRFNDSLRYHCLCPSNAPGSLTLFVLSHWFASGNAFLLCCSPHQRYRADAMAAITTIPPEAPPEKILCWDTTNKVFISGPPVLVSPNTGQRSHHYI